MTSAPAVPQSFPSWISKSNENRPTKTAGRVSCECQMTDPLFCGKGIATHNCLQSTSLRPASYKQWILPRAKNMLSPACFYTSVRTGAALSNPMSSPAKQKTRPFGLVCLSMGYKKDIFAVLRMNSNSYVVQRFL